jgi:hypothetical protein
MNDEHFLIDKGKLDFYQLKMILIKRTDIYQRN